MEQERDGYLVAPWHGRNDGERGEAFAARLQAETGCLVADRRNGRIVDLGRAKVGRTARRGAALLRCATALDPQDRAAPGRRPAQPDPLQRLRDLHLRAVAEA